MTNDQFWNWIRGWKDADALCDEAEMWDIETKERELKKFKQIGLLKEVI